MSIFRQLAKTAPRTGLAPPARIGKSDHTAPCRDQHHWQWVAVAV